MSGLTGNPQGINSLPNCLATRADLSGQGMDQGHFVFAPYAGKAVCVCLTNGMPDFAADYHLRAVKIPARINPMNVYVRFAWGLFRALPNVLRELANRPDVVIIAEPAFLPASDRTPATKRQRTEGKSAPRGTQERNADGGNEKQEQDDEAPMLTDDDGSHQELSDDAALERPLELYTLTERDLEAAEGLDADLDGRPLGEPYEGYVSDFGQLTAGPFSALRGGSGHLPGILKDDASQARVPEAAPRGLCCGERTGGFCLGGRRRAAALSGVKLVTIADLQ